MNKLAVRDIDTAGGDITKLENELEAVKIEVEKTRRTREALQAEIDKKTSDYSIYISQRDAETKKAYADLLNEREKLTSDKVEFQKILQAYKLEKVTLENERRDFEIQKLRHASTIQNIQEFITAVRRAYGLLGA